MKYCAYFSQKSSILDKVDEINVDYDPRELTFVTFLQEHENQRVNICFFDPTLLEDGISRIIAIHEKYPQLNLAIKFSRYDKELDKYIDICKENNIPFYFSDFITSWDSLHGYVNLGVSDVFIVEELGFELDAVYEITSRANVRIRVFPNVAQSSWKTSPEIKRFFIRPEDTPIYEQYVDVFEFFGDTNRINIMYDVYAVDKEWFGTLDELIIGIHSKIDNRTLTGVFPVRRIKCGKRCMKGKGCNICEIAADLASTLHENGFIIEHHK